MYFRRKYKNSYEKVIDFSRIKLIVLIQFLNIKMKKKKKYLIK